MITLSTAPPSSPDSSSSIKIIGLAPVFSKIIFGIANANASDDCFSSPRELYPFDSTPSTDTIKKVMGDQILETLSRETIWRAQTPQVFSKPALIEAIQIAIDEKLEGTDEASILEKIGYQIGFVEGSPLNIKITTKEDWIFAKAIYNELND